MRTVYLFLFSAFISIAALDVQAQECPLPPSPLLDTALADVLDTDRVFMGCRPSAGECVNSCPDRRGQSEVDPAVCDPSSPYEGLACYCLLETSPIPEGPPPDHFFMGCRPSAGECMNSCPSRKGYAEADPSVCDPDSYYEGLACYCAP